MSKSTFPKVHRKGPPPSQRPVPAEQPFAPYQVNTRLPDPPPPPKQPIPPPHAYPPHQ
jgi:hypothetical protein